MIGEQNAVQLLPDEKCYNYSYKDQVYYEVHKYFLTDFNVVKFLYTVCGHKMVRKETANISEMYAYQKLFQKKEAWEKDFGI